MPCMKRIVWRRPRNLAALDTAEGEGSSAPVIVLAEAGMARDGEAVGQAFAEGLDLRFLVQGEHQQLGVGALVEFPEALQLLPEPGIIEGLPGAVAMPGKAGGVQLAAQGLPAGHR